MGSNETRNENERPKVGERKRRWKHWGENISRCVKNNNVEKTCKASAPDPLLPHCESLHFGTGAAGGEVLAL